MYIIHINVFLELTNIFSLCGCKSCIPENIMKLLINNISSISSFFYSLYFGLEYGDLYDEKMECSDFVSNSNYNIMIEKIHNNGIRMKISSYLIIVLFILNIFSVIIMVVEKSCQDFFKEKCEECCCSCCINCLKNDASDRTSRRSSVTSCS